MGRPIARGSSGVGGGRLVSLRAGKLAASIIFLLHIFAGNVVLCKQFQICKVYRIHCQVFEILKYINVEGKPRL